jgi:platelet-activating factor acetylhydrolase
MGEANRK